MRRILLDEDSVTDLLLPQTALPSLVLPPIFAGNYPRKVAGASPTLYTGHDWHELLTNRAIRMVLITASGRLDSGGDSSRAPWSRPRMDIQCFGPTENDAMTVLLTI